MSSNMAFICIVLSALCTFCIRILPFIVLGGRREIPQKIKYLGKALPSAIMAVLIIYCLKDIIGSFTTIGLSKIIAVAVCVAIHLWKKNNLLSIVISTGVYMILCSIL